MRDDQRAKLNELWAAIDAAAELDDDFLFYAAVAAKDAYVEEQNIGGEIP
jgi:hypothetical protein